jgi:hypothetical protein
MHEIDNLFIQKVRSFTEIEAGKFDYDQCEGYMTLVMTVLGSK